MYSFILKNEFLLSPLFDLLKEKSKFFASEPDYDDDEDEDEDPEKDEEIDEDYDEDEEEDEGYDF